MAYLLAAGMLAGVAGAVVLIAGAAIGWGLRRGWRPWVCVGVGAIALLAVIGGGLAWLGAETGRSPVQAWHQEFDRSLTISLEVYRNLGWEEAELQRTARIVRFLFVDAAFGWMIVIAAGVSFILFLILRRIVSQWPGSRIEMRPFSAWVVPDHLIWLLLAALSMILLGSRLPDGFSAAAWNVLVVLGNAYFLGGVTVAVFFMEKRKVARAFQILFLLAVGLLPMLAALLILVGVFDTWWDWRRVKTLH